MLLEILDIFQAIEVTIIISFLLFWVPQVVTCPTGEGGRGYQALSGVVAPNLYYFPYTA